MRIDTLTLRGYRNYADATVRFDGAVNVISGRNAQGKTNLLEAAFLLSGGRSFRTRLDRELIGFSEDFSSVNADVFSGGRAQQIEIILRRGGKSLLLALRSREKRAGSPGGRLRGLPEKIISRIRQETAGFIPNIPCVKKNGKGVVPMAHGAQRRARG